MAKSYVKKQLKALLEQDASVNYKEGKWAGRKWARTLATPKELLRLAIYCEGYPDGRKPWWDSDASGRETLAYAVRPELMNDDDALEDFWEEVLGGDAYRIDDSVFLHGFGNAALDVWQEKC
jgi:hypothetical protein